MVTTGPLFAHTMTGDRAAGATHALTLERPPPGPWPSLPTGLQTKLPWTDRSGGRSTQLGGILERIVALHVVPRLTLGDADETQHRLPGGAIEEFAACLLAPDIAPARAFADAAMQGGSSATSLYLDLFEPAARRLGELWNCDSVDFTGVTIGLVRLQQLLRAFGPAFHATDVAPRPDRDILLAAPAGAPHMFGIAMVRAFFQRAGWHVWNTPPANDADLAAAVRHNRFDVVGFSVACADQLPAVRASIRMVRRASQNRHVAIMVGGPACIGDPERVAELGADATAANADHAVKQAERLLAVRTPLE